MTPRIPPLALTDSEAEELLDALPKVLAVLQPPVLNIFATFWRHPDLLRRWSAFAGQLLGGRLGHREREILILRTSWNCRSRYEWGHHLSASPRLGLADGDIDRIIAGPEESGWVGLDQALLRAADELHSGARVTDATWSELAAELDDRQLIEVPIVVGQYHLAAFLTNSLDVRLEDPLHLPSGRDPGR